MKFGFFSGKVTACWKGLLLGCLAVGLSLFAGHLPVSAHDVTLSAPFIFSGSGHDSYQSITHEDADPWKGFVTLTATNTGTQSWTDFHFGIFSVGSDVSHVYFQGGTPTSSNGTISWMVNNSNPARGPRSICISRTPKRDAYCVRQSEFRDALLPDDGSLHPRCRLAAGLGPGGIDWNQKEEEKK